MGFRRQTHSMLVVRNDKVHASAICRKLVQWYRRYNWHSVERQIESVAKIRDMPFLHLLPGHGRPGQFADDREREEYFSEALKAEGYTAEHLVGAK